MLKFTVFFLLFLSILLFIPSIFGFYVDKRVVFNNTELGAVTLGNYSYDLILVNKTDVFYNLNSSTATTFNYSVFAKITNANIIIQNPRTPINVTGVSSYTFSSPILNLFFSVSSRKLTVWYLTAISISVSDGAVNFGIRNLSSSDITSWSFNDNQTITNNGNTPVNLFIRALNGTFYNGTTTLSYGVTAGNDQVKFLWYNASGSGVPITMNDVQFATNVGVGAANAKKLGFVLATPTSVSTSAKGGKLYKLYIRITATQA